jgi:hypothetical protein
MAVSEVSISPGLALILDRAGNKSDVDFNYLVQTAIRESSLDPAAKASTSSATGLFQFVEQTWFEVMKSDGGRLGYAGYADAIETKADGTLDIADNKLRAEVLSLRENPEVAADLAAAFTRNNGAYLENRFGRMPSAGELYIAHFLGARGAEKFFVAGLQDPDQNAAELFPAEANANPSIFYDDGKARTIRDVYRVLVDAHNSLGNDVSAPTANTGVTAAATQSTSLPMSFADLYSSEAVRSKSPLIDEPKVNAGFFAQLYST